LPYRFKCIAGQKTRRQREDRGTVLLSYFFVLYLLHKYFYFRELFCTHIHLISRGEDGMSTVNLENKRLVNDIKKGQLQDLVQWIHGNKDKLYKIAWSYLYNHADIEDVFQDTLIKVYENIDTLKNPNYFETWYISILINECRKRLRHRKKEVLQESIDFDEHYIDEYNFFQDLNSLDEIYKVVIVLKYISGYSQEEIASILDIPIGTVKSRIYRGIRELRKLVKEV